MDATETKQPTMGDVFQQFFGQASSNARMCIPGLVRSVPAGGKVSIEIAVEGKRNGQTVKEPILLSVPVLSYGNPRLAVCGPVLPGDPGILLFGDRDLDRWKGANGLLKTEAATGRTHDLTDSLFLPVVLGQTASVELWGILCSLLTILTASVGVAPGAPQTFVTVTQNLLTRLVAAGVVPS